MENGPADRRASNSGHSAPASGDEKTRSRPAMFYGWWIVGAATLAGTVQSALFNIGAAALFLPVAREFGTTRAVVAGAFAFSRLEGGLTGPIEGYLIHWVGPRRYMMVGWVIFGLGLVGIGLSQSVIQFYAGFLVATLGQSMAGFLPIVTVLVNWFSRRRGRAIAIYQMGTSIAALLVPLLAWSILNIGWRETITVAGVVAIVLGIPLTAVMRARPEDYGLLPDGDQAEVPAPEAMGQQPELAQGPTSTAKPSSTIAQALRSRNFWFLGSAHLLSLCAWGALRVHEIPALVDMGLEEQTAANVFAFSLIVAAGGRLIGGFLGDLIGPRKVLMVAYLLQSVAITILAFATTLTHALIFAVIFGVSWGARGTLMTLMRGEVFGRTNFSRLAGLMDPVSMGGVVLSPIFAGLTYDALGSYRYAFLIIAVLSATGIFLLLGLRLPSRQATTPRPQAASSP
jgi:MFS family permease